MKTQYYIAWLGRLSPYGFHSVATGKNLETVKAQAITVYQSDDYQRFSSDRNILRITVGTNQKVLSEERLEANAN